MYSHATRTWKSWRPWLWLHTYSLTAGHRILQPTMRAHLLVHSHTRTHAPGSIKPQPLLLILIFLLLVAMSKINLMTSTRKRDGIMCKRVWLRACSRFRLRALFFFLACIVLLALRMRNTAHTTCLNSKQKQETSVMRHTLRGILIIFLGVNNRCCAFLANVM